MRTRSVVATTFAFVLLGAGGWSVVAGPSRVTEDAKASPQDPIHSIMMGHMMDGRMMGGCPMMEQLPPGNGKLSMQIHGEMMQATGEILCKYTDKIQMLPSK